MKKILIILMFIVLSAVLSWSSDFNETLKRAQQGDAIAQFQVGNMYRRGQEVEFALKKTIYWYKKAAEQGYAIAMLHLGNMYELDSIKNYELAYAWYYIAGTEGYELAIPFRESLAKNLSFKQLRKARKLATKIKYKIYHPNKIEEYQPSISNTEKKIIGSGTGFVITIDGYILTCYHVIENSNNIKVSVEKKIYSAKLVRDDSNNDLALLKIKGSFSAISLFSKRPAKMGQEVFTIGYPNPGLQGVNAKFTKGTISSLTGFQDDLRLYQISVPVQPGNSGGALADEDGNILGIIVAMLSTKATFNISGSLPQNVNYAVKIIHAQSMLDTLPEIAKKLILPLENKSNAVARVKKSTVMILSYE